MDLFDLQRKDKENMSSVLQVLDHKLNQYGKLHDTVTKTDCEVQTSLSYMEDSKNQIALVNRLQELQDESQCRKYELDFYKDSMEHFNRQLELEKKKNRKCMNSLKEATSQILELKSEISQMTEQIDFIESEASLTLADLREQTDLERQALSSQIFQLQMKLNERDGDCETSQSLLTQANKYIESIEDELSTARQLADDEFKSKYLELLQSCETWFENGHRIADNDENSINPSEGPDLSPSTKSISHCQCPREIYPFLACEIIRHRIKNYRKRSEEADSKVEKVGLQLWSLEAHTDRIKNILFESEAEIPEHIFVKLKNEIIFDL